jgi:hypothetical protein
VRWTDLTSEVDLPKVHPRSPERTHNVGPTVTPRSISVFEQENAGTTGKTLGGTRCRMQPDLRMNRLGQSLRACCRLLESTWSCSYRAEAISIGDAFLTNDDKIVIGDTK